MHIHLSRSTLLGLEATRAVLTQTYPKLAAAYWLALDIEAKNVELIGVEESDQEHRVYLRLFSSLNFPMQVVCFVQFQNGAWRSARVALVASSLPGFERQAFDCKIEGNKIHVEKSLLTERQIVEQF